MREFLDSRFVRSAAELWPEATDAEFLRAVGNDTLPEEAFHRWLVQDYLFARGLTAFEGVAVAHTPRPAQKALIAGLGAMSGELDWFEEHAAERGLNLNAQPHPVCKAYIDFLTAAAYTQPYPVLLAILYGVEVSYLCAWSALEARGSYAEFIQRWSNEDFADYVRDLLQLAEEHEHPQQQEYFDEVLRHEAAFWRMTWEG